MKYIWVLVVFLLANNIYAKDISGGIQDIYKKGVPHINNDGSFTTGYSKNSFFPLGMWVLYLNQFKEIKDANFNLVMYGGDERTIYKDPEKTKEFLKKYYYNNDLKFIVYSALNKEMIEFFSKEKCVLAYYIIDEPNRFLYYPGEDMEQIYKDTKNLIDLVHTYDKNRMAFVNLVPYHAFTEDVDRVWWKKYFDISDISSADCYPIYSKDTPLVEIAKTVEDMVKFNDGKKPVWFIMQGHSDKRSNNFPDCTMPTPKQYRGEAYISIIHGATGLMTFKMQEKEWILHPALGPNTKPYTEEEKKRLSSDPNYIEITEELAKNSVDVWKEAINLNKEIESLKPVIFSSTSGEKYSIELKSGDLKEEAPIRSLLKYYNGYYYLFTANIDNPSLDIAFNFKKKVTDLELLFDKDSSVKSKDNSILATYNSLDVKIFKFKLK